MVDRRVGTLPAPLSTIVFHYDEENGGQPCEAAFLSELKDRSGPGVQEVVVLVSPTSLQRRRKVYQNLPHVRVEALRIAEKELNASRMLCMMGADNLEQVPLYLHTALSILRDMSAENFIYQDFRKRLKEPRFNRNQNSMLQLRLDLLDSFLKGSDADMSSYFKPGRLVIIDLSDPFVDGTTAAMLFDICLGLFIEWKVSTGKLIVLDEAHKYLTNSDANQFTKRICSTIRQQRHLAARVVVSTQEPTIVPSSVLDLLSWIICHRFSSPSWVKHLMDHVCVHEGRQKSDDRKDSEAGDSDSAWEKRVMTLHTGEAIVFSPSSLFVSAQGKLATLATGYALIKTRPRLTRDGGASIFALNDAADAPMDVGLLTPDTPEIQEVIPSALAIEVNKSLIEAINHVSNGHNSPWVNSSAVANALLKSNPLAYSGSFKSFLTEISTTNIVFMRGEGVEFEVTLHPSLRDNAKGKAAETFGSSSLTTFKFEPLSNSTDSTEKPATSGLSYPDKFQSLVDAIRKLEPSPGEWVWISRIGSQLGSSGYKNNGYSRLKPYIEAAQEAGILSIRDRGSQKQVSLII